MKRLKPYKQPAFAAGPMHIKRATPGAGERWRARLSFLWSDWSVTAAAGVLVVFVLFAALANVIAPYPATEIHFDAPTQPPSSQYLLGTDNLGRDILSRVIHGTRGILSTSVIAALLGVVLGTLLGLISGYAGGWVDEIIMRVADAWLSLPSMLLALLLLATLGRTRIPVILGVGIVYIPEIARVIRSAVLAVKDLEFVQAARLRGESTPYILFGEILPNIWSPIVVEISIRVSYAVLLTASFGFLGLGVQEPDPDWGLMVSRARAYIQIAPWMALAPVMAISLLVVSVSIIADALESQLSARPEPHG